MLILAKEALLDSLSPEELRESITPNLIKEGLEGLPIFKNTEKDNREIASIICTIE